MTDSDVYMSVPLSNVDINKAIKQFESRGANIISDAEITPITPIESIFNQRGHAIVYHGYPNSKIGHWWTLLRDPFGTVCILDSFGKSSQYYCKNLLPCLKNAGIKQVIVNKKKWQNDKSSICGRYGILLSVCHKMKMKIPEIYKFMEEGKKKYGSYDKFVLHLTT